MDSSGNAHNSNKCLSSKIAIQLNTHNTRRHGFSSLLWWRIFNINVNQIHVKRKVPSVRWWFFYFRSCHMCQTQLFAKQPPCCPNRWLSLPRPQHALNEHDVLQRNSIAGCIRSQDQELNTWQNNTDYVVRFMCCIRWWGNGNTTLFTWVCV